MIAHHPGHPAQHLIRLANVLVAAVCAWGVWCVIQWAFEDLPRFSWWHLMYLIPLIAFAGCGAFFCWGVKTPTQSHLSLIVTAGFFTALGLIVTFGSRFIHWLVIPDAAETVNRILFWPALIVTLMVAITIDWRMGKAAGFVPAEDMWWGERNIRGFCSFLAWVMFFAGIGWMPPEPVLEELFNHPIPPPVSLLLFVAFIATCLFIGKTLPRFVMALTGIEPQPQESKPRRRGFRLY